ncbi:hypothetical protein AAE478_008466 [Parahypoxylon ruwenzoriense]
MSSTELFRDPTATLTKTQRPTTSKSKKLDRSSPQSDAPISRIEHGNRFPNPSVSTDGATLSQPASYRTVAHDSEPSYLRPTTSPEQGDDIRQSSVTPTSSQESEFTKAQILNPETPSFPPVPPNAAAFPPLPKPVLIPRLGRGPQKPFARAWALELENHAITREDLVSFIDNLNVIIAPHGAAQAVDLASLVVGFVPFEGASGISLALSGVAMLTALGTTHQHSEYFKKMNENYFHPRKLHAKIVNSKKIMKMFNLDKKEMLVAPLTEDTLELSAQERCLKSLSQWSCEFSFDVPPLSEPTDTMGKLAAWEVKQHISKADKKAKKSRDRAWKKYQEGEELKESKAEASRAKHLDWILIQNLDEWEAAKAEKQAKREKK